MGRRKMLCLIFVTFVFISCRTDSEKNLKQSLERKSWQATESGDFIKSINYYNRLIAMDSANGAYYFGRGYSYLKLAKIEDALEDFFESVKLNYRRSSSFYNIGLLNSHVNDSVALTYFRKAVQLEPDNLKFKEDYDECLRRLGQQKKQ
jgi:tetratricopeptide (TPR) repeat protein